MARILASKKFVTALYSFDVDGGALATIGLGVFIPNNSVITYCCIKVNASFASNEDVGPTLVELGWAGNTNALMVGNDWDHFVAGQVYPCRDFADTPIETTASREIAITFGDSVLTGGIAIIICEFIELDL